MRVWVAVAEASGDALAASLIDELRLRDPGLELRGLVGPACREREVQIVERAEDATSLGIVESVQRAPRLLRLLRRLEEDVLDWRPDVVLTVDSPSLLLRLARRVPGPKLHWVAPQVWAWRAGRARRIAATVDTLCCLLPFEPAWFREYPVRAVFTGHPGAARVAHRIPERPTLALLPGSRPDEIRRLWPILRDVAALVKRRVTDLEIVVGVAPTVDRADLGGLACRFEEGLSAAVASASVAVTCSGTASLQVAAHGVPQVVVYRVAPLTWAIGQRIVRGVDHTALPNILAGAEIVPEYLQRIDPETVASEVVRLLAEPGAQLAEVAPLLDQLEPEGAIARVADEVERLRARRSSPPGRSPTA